jgi:hypothetical protein
VTSLLLKRFDFRDDRTYGALIGPQGPFIFTLENPWLENKPQVSCIPFGTYACRRVQSPRFGNTFEVTGVPGRSHILFHAGNTEADTLGCVLTATTFDPVQGVNGAVQSKKAFDELMFLLRAVQQFTLHIVHC